MHRRLLRLGGSLSASVGVIAISVLLCSSIKRILELMFGAASSEDIRCDRRLEGWKRNKAANVEHCTMLTSFYHATVDGWSLRAMT